MSSIAKQRICLVGAPNAGKTSLYNWLTDSKFKTVNYPGATVEIAIGETAQKFGAPLSVYDSPGTYTLFPKSYDEKVAVDSLYEFDGAASASLVVGVVDATQLSRHLYVVIQLKEAGFPVVVALTNLDLLRAQGKEIDFQTLEKNLQVPCVEVNGRTGEGVDQLVKAIRARLNQSGDSVPKNLAPWSREVCERVFSSLGVLSRSAIGSVGSKTSDAFEQTKKIDRVLLHPVWGLLLFMLAMTVLFSAVFWMAQPLMDLIDQFFGSLAEAVVQNMSPGLWTDFLANGVVAGLGAVLIFLPQILILFLCITFLEDSGYLARAASLVDWPLSKIGLNGRSFVPLLSGNACAIPAMMAARTISSKKERLLTLLIIPLMSCSARLPVYALLLGFIFQNQPAWYAGVSLAAIYFGSFVIAAMVSTVAARLMRSQEASFFMLELPVYRRPQWRNILRLTWNKGLAYVQSAAPIIFVLALAVWGACTFPNYQLEDPSDRLNQSYAADVGRWIEPVMEPMGGDWRVGLGLVSAFAAREVFVSSLAVIFHITDEGDEDSLRTNLMTKMSEAKNLFGDPLFTVASAVGLIVFFMIALQCMATFGVARREFGSWSWAFTQLILFNVLAYFLAVGVVQGLRFIGIS